MKRKESAKKGRLFFYVDYGERSSNLRIPEGLLEIQQTIQLTCIIKVGVDGFLVRMGLHEYRI